MAETAPQPAGRIAGWLEERFGVSAISYPVPRHANSVGYTLGGITLGSFALLVVTGVYLSQLYDPTTERAHASVVAITDDPFNSVVRSVHFWLATIFLVTLILHLLRTFVTASYKRPREGTWLTGVALFALGGGALFTGTILKWDQEAIEALAHNQEIGKLLGAVGFWFSGDFADNVALLTRDYIAHVSILPLLIIGVVAVHFFLVKRHKLSPLAWGTPEQVEERASSETTLPFTSHLAHIGYYTLVVLSLALVLAALRPTGIGPQGVEGIEITKPPWYFLWVYPFENWFGLKALVVAPGLLMAGLAALPFADRNAERDPRRRRFWMVLAVVVLAAWVALSVYGYESAPVSHVGEM